MSYHWRKPYQPTSHSNSFIVWLIGGSVVLAALVLLSQHVHI